MNIEPFVREHLSKAYVMQLATAVSDQPWLCTVHFMSTDDLKFYWLSKAGTRHSQEIARNPKAAAAVAVQTEAPVIGVQLEGDTAVVDDPAELEMVIGKYAQRHNRDEAEIKSALSGSEPRQFYRLTPRTIVIFDKQNFPQDPRQEWHINQV